MGRKRYITWSATDLAQFKQLMSRPVLLEDLISKRSTRSLAFLGFVDVDEKGTYFLNERGEGIAGILQETEDTQDMEEDT